MESHWGKAWAQEVRGHDFDLQSLNWHELCSQTEWLREEQGEPSEMGQCFFSDVFKEEKNTREKVSCAMKDQKWETDSRAGRKWSIYRTPSCMVRHTAECWEKKRCQRHKGIGEQSTELNWISEQIHWVLEKHFRDYFEVCLSGICIHVGI